MKRLAVLVALSLCSLALAEDDPEAAKSAAKTYLEALSGEGSDSGKDLLLGGVTMNAQMFSIDNWRVVSETRVREETGDLKKAHVLMSELDHTGHAAVHALMSTAQEGDDLTVHQLSGKEANKLLGPTKVKADRFDKAYPVLAYVARVTKPLYWHPNNPIRPLLAKAGNHGTYHLTVHRYVIESVEGPGKNPRTWPLRVLRFRTDSLDTGWKVLPASDWNGE